jgi:oligopeptide transport system permease protein
MGSLIAIIGLAIFAIIGPDLRGLDYVSINIADKNKGISVEYWFGADNMGRDLFSNLWLGLRISLLVALVCGAIQFIVGSVVGGLMAYFGGLVDILGLRMLEIISSVPHILLVMIFMMILGNGVPSLLVAISLTSWVETARQTRGQIMQLREMDYVLAAEVLGVSKWKIITRHLLPNTMGVSIVNLTASIPGYIFTESGLSFIGLGLQAPSVSLGTLIASGQVNMDFYPYQLFFPCLMLCITVLAFNLLGDGLRNALDPRLRQ